MFKDAVRAGSEQIDKAMTYFKRMVQIVGGKAGTGASASTSSSTCSCG